LDYQNGVSLSSRAMYDNQVPSISLSLMIEYVSTGNGEPVIKDGAVGAVEPIFGCTETQVVGILGFVLDNLVV
jgi:hypothetical protein